MLDYHVGLLMNYMNYYIIYSNNNVLLYVMGLLKPLKKTLKNLLFFNLKYQTPISR
jgi:hypothetical protein